MFPSMLDILRFCRIICGQLDYSRLKSVVQSQIWVTLYRVSFLCCNPPKKNESKSKTEINGEWKRVERRMTRQSTIRNGWNFIFKSLHFTREIESLQTSHGTNSVFKIVTNDVRIPTTTTRGDQNPEPRAR